MNQLLSIHLEIVNVYHYQKEIFKKLKLKKFHAQFHHFKNDFLDEFNKFKTKFFQEVK